jgi:hypothetical protein
MNPAPKGDPTGKYTLNEWGQTEADFAFFDLAHDKVELKSDGWRTEKIADHPNVYEWWYFDIHNRDGTIVTGMLSSQTAVGRVPRFGAPRAHVQDRCQPKQGGEHRARNVPN